MSDKNFPLYTSLLASASEKGLNVKEQNELQGLMKRMDLNGHERMYILIRLYSIHHPDVRIPAPSEENDGDIDIDVLRLPGKLQRMVLAFAQLHIKSYEEDSKKSKLEQKQREA